jgi:hypothetical protein
MKLNEGWQAESRPNINEAAIAARIFNVARNAHPPRLRFGPSNQLAGDKFVNAISVFWRRLAR